MQKGKVLLYMSVCGERAGGGPHIRVFEENEVYTFENLDCDISVKRQ